MNLIDELLSAASERLTSLVQDLPIDADQIMAGVVAIAGLTVVWSSIRAVTAWKLRAGRTTFALYPALDFDPKEEDVNRWAGMLSRIPQASKRLWRPPQATGFRVTLTMNRDRQAVQLLTIPQWAEEMVRAHSLSGLELRSVSEVMAPHTLAAISIKDSDRRERDGETAVEVGDDITVEMPHRYAGTVTGDVTAELAIELSDVDPYGRGATHDEVSYAHPEQLLVDFDEKGM